VKDDTFDLSCGVVYYGNYLFEYDGLADMTECISNCVDTDDCIGVNWVEAGEVQDSSICLLIVAAIDLTEAVGNTAFLSSYTVQPIPER
jgi:hypothetical protein